MRRNLGNPETAPMHAAEADAVSAYHDALFAQDGLALRTADALGRAQQDRGLVVGGRPLCAVLRPRFMGQGRHDTLAAVASVLYSLLERAGSHILASDRLLGCIGADEAERRAWEIDPGYAGFTLTSRLDSFMVEDRPRFVEYNAESPAGIAFSDVLADVFGDLPGTSAWGGMASCQAPHARPHLLETLRWAYREWGGTGTPTVAVIDWDDVVTRRDFELCADYFRENGVPTVITDPRSLIYRNGKVWCGDTRVSLVYRRVLLHELLAKEDEIRPLMQAYRDGAICMVNSPRSKLLHKKSVLALLSDGSLGLSMDDAEREVVEQCLPWTRMLAPGETAYQGERRDLAQLLELYPERFTIKPSDDYGGRGVVLGWDVTRDEWLAAIERGLEGGYVVQERVPVPEEPYPVLRDGQVETVTMLLDSNPLLFRGRMGSVLTRLSASALLNVTAGTGSAVATFVLKEEA